MADITALTAPIGGGKSFFATIRICQDLEKSDCLIVTDVPLILENAPEGYWTIAEYCHKYISRPVNVNERLAVLSYEMALEFWRYVPAQAFTQVEIEESGLEVVEHVWKYGRSRFVKLKNINNERFGLVPDFTFRTGTTDKPKWVKGCNYYIDEAHKKFPPMYYQKVGAQAEWYMSEMRKLNDNFVWITQHPEKVDKNFRRNSTEWLQVQNMSKTRLFMGVTFKNRFRWYWYNQQEMPTRNDKPSADGWYRFDKERRYEFLYRTMDGTGVSGALQGSEGTRFKGRHPAVWVLAIVIVLVGAFLLPKVLMYTMQTLVGGVTNGTIEGIKRGVGGSDMLKAAGAVMAEPPKAVPVAPAPVIIKPVEFRRPAADAERGRLSRAPVVPPSSDAIYCRGFCPVGTNMVAFLSNGEIISTEDGELMAYGKQWIMSAAYGKIRVHTQAISVPNEPIRIK